MMRIPLKSFWCLASLFCVGAIVNGLAQQPAFTFDLNHRIQLLAFSSDGRLLAADDAYDLVVFDTETGVIKGRLDKPGYSVNSAIFSNDSEFLITGNNDGKVRWFDTETFSLQRTFSVTKWSIYNLAISADGKFLFIDAADGTIEVWDVKKGERRWTLGSKGQRPRYLSLSPDNNFLATEDLDRKFNFFDLRTSTTVFSTDASSLSPFCFCGNEIALTRHDSVSYRNSQNGELIRSSRIPREVVPFTAKPGGMGGSFHGQVVLSPDCQTVAVNNWSSKIISLLDARTMEVRKSLDGSKSKGSNFVFAFSPDSRFIAVGSTDGKVRLWKAK